MARHVGAAIARRYEIPVYLYEAAATSPERQNLESVRRGQFEGLRDEIATNSARKPDFGERRIHPTADAIVVGARKFPIACNILLNTADIDIAKKVAKAIRFSSGGLRFVKRAGFLVCGMAQISMNLTDFEQTPIHRVFELVRREAARYGATPVSSEIVGVIPKLALEQAAEWFLQIENFDSSLILEDRLAAVMSGKVAVGGLRAGVEPFIEQLAAMAAALATVVATMSPGKWHTSNTNRSCPRQSPGWPRCFSQGSVGRNTPLKIAPSIVGPEVLCWSPVASCDLNAVSEFAKLSGQGSCTMDERVWFGFNALLDVADSLMKDPPDQAA